MITFTNCTNDCFIAPIVKAAKKDGSIKLALDAKPVNAQIHKNKYQMPVVDELLTNVSNIISEAKPEQGVWFTKLDLNYAYSQLPLSKKTSKHCNPRGQSYLNLQIQDRVLWAHRHAHRIPKSYGTHTDKPAKHVLFY